MTIYKIPLRNAFLEKISNSLSHGIIAFRSIPQNHTERVQFLFIFSSSVQGSVQFGLSQTETHLGSQDLCFLGLPPISNPKNKLDGPETSARGPKTIEPIFAASQPVLSSAKARLLAIEPNTGPQYIFGVELSMLGQAIPLRIQRPKSGPFRYR